MKIAIIGSGPAALLAASHFDRLGAEVIVFQRSFLGGNLRFLNKYFPEFKITFKKQEFKAAHFLEKELFPIMEHLEAQQLTMHGDVLRVHKRFLKKSEMIQGHTRLHDLFRVIYSLNPQETILKQVEENPEMFKQLGQEVIESLHKPVENFLDCDIVIDATGLGRSPRPMGAGESLALNENNLQGTSALYYQKDIFTKLSLEDKKAIILIGYDRSAKLALIYFEDWLLSSRAHKLSWVCSEKLKLTPGNWLDDGVIRILTALEKSFETAKMSYEAELFKWRDLDDFVKVKIPKPSEPESSLALYEGYDVTSVDRLLDRENVFATIESPDFREYAKEKSDLKTLAADCICIANEVLDETLGAGTMLVNEPGYYTLRATEIDLLLEEISQIEADILNYFKRA